MEKPNYLKVDIEGIQPELLEYNQWVLWQARWKNEKWAKVPIDAKNLKAASSTNPKTWSDFNTVYERYQTNKGDINGIGFVLTKEDKFCGFDFDHCVKNSAINHEVAEYIAKLKSYAEYSPSGDGVRQFCFGELPDKGRKKGNFECYASGRYLSVTGHHIFDSPIYVRNAADVIPEVHAAIFGTSKTQAVQQSAGNSPLSDDEVIQKIQCSHQSVKFGNLYELGEFQDYPSQSEADLALCSILAFWCNRDSAQIDRIFRKSKLMRDKWDKVHGSDTYGNLTIKKAANNSVEVYKQKVPNAGDISQLEIKTALYEEEDGDAGVFMRIYRDRLSYDHAGKNWYRWSDHFWILDKVDEHIRSIDAVIHTYQREQSFLFKEMQEKARNGGDTDKIKEILELISKRVRALHKRDRKVRIADLATKGAASLGITGEEWDLHTWVFACNNGVIDLKTGDLRPGRSSDYIRTVAPVDYPGIGAKCPKWERFINSVFDGDQELISFVHRVLGYSLLGSAIEHILPILWGQWEKWQRHAA